MSDEFPNEYHLAIPWAPTEICDCPKAPCGLVPVSGILDSCEQHNPIRRRSIQKGHTADRCPGG